MSDVAQPAGLPRGVYRQRRRLADGSQTVYYRLRSTGARILGEPGTSQFLINWEAARKAGRRHEMIYERHLLHWVDEIATASRYRARARALAYDLTGDFLQSLIVAQGMVCAMTGLPFDMETRRRVGKRDPFQPSIDRIDSAKGYVQGNVRIVCFAVNVALNEWGEDAFFRIAEAAIAARDASSG